MAFLWHDDCGMIVWTMRRDTTASDEEASAQVLFGGPKKVFSPLVTSTTESYTDVSFWLL